MGEYATAFAKAPRAGFDIGIDTVLAKRCGHDGIYGRDYGLGLHRLIHLPGKAEIGGDFHEMRVSAGRGENKDVDIPAGQAAGGFLKRANIAGKLPAINLLTRRSRNQIGPKIEKLEPPAKCLQRPVDIERNARPGIFSARKRDDSIG